MPKSTTSTSSGSSRPASLRTTSTPKPSSPRNMLPMPATRMRLFMSKLRGELQVQRFDLLGGEEEPVTEYAILSQVPTRVVLKGHRDIDPVLVVLLYALDERGFPTEREVHDVPSGVGPEQDPAPLLELYTLHNHALKLGSVLVLSEEVLHATPSASGSPGRSRSAS